MHLKCRGSKCLGNSSILALISVIHISVSEENLNERILSSSFRIRMKARLSRVNILLLHLAIADLFVTFLMMPLEVSHLSLAINKECHYRLVKL